MTDQPIVTPTSPRYLACEVRAYMLVRTREEIRDAVRRGEGDRAKSFVRLLCAALRTYYLPDVPECLR